VTTKIVALVDAPRNLARFLLLPGHRHDCVGVESLINVDFDDDIDWLRTELNERGAVAVISPKATRKQPIATRYEKIDQSFSAMIYLVGAAIWLR
jgi:hypothetical protein